jgi:hypothetical protein
MHKTSVVIICGIAAAACAKKPTSAGGGNGAKVSLQLAVVGGGSASRDATHTSLARDTANKNVSATGAGLESLKLHIGNVQICQNITTSGTAIATTSGCLTLYQGPVDTALANTDLTAAIAEAAAVTDGYIDLMDPASRAALSQTVTVTAADAHDYNYGLVSWDPPIKVKATLTDPADGTTPVLYTQPGAASAACSVNNNVYGCVLASTPLSSGPAAEAIFSANGNIAFKFQKPLTISADDVTNQTAYALTLAFNPNGIVQGVMAPGATNFPPLSDGISLTPSSGYNIGNTISFVGAQMAAIFYKSSTQVMRESYSAQLTAPDGAKFALRIEFYTLADDPDHAIYGVSAATIPTADTTSGYLVGYEQIDGITTHSDSSIDLLDYQGTAQITNFVRSQTQGTVQTTPALIACGSPMSLLGCTGATGGPISATFTLDALTAL